MDNLENGGGPVSRESPRSCKTKPEESTGAVYDRRGLGEAENCWERFDCGRERGGATVEEQGLCPAATESVCDGINDGINAGRICWAVAGTFSGRVAVCSMAMKIGTCLSCDFFYEITRDSSVEMTRPGQTRWLALQ